MATSPKWCRESLAVSMGGCIASALTGWSAVEVVGAILGTVGPRARGTLAAVATRRVAAADRPPDGQTRALGAGVCVADRWGAAAPTAAGGPLADRGRARGDQPWYRRRWLRPSDRQAAGTGAFHGVARELARNGGRSRYRAQRADAAAIRRAARPKPSKLVVDPRLRAVVEAKLALRWSPEQIAGWLRVTYPDDPPCGSPTRPSTSACMCPTVGGSAATGDAAYALAGRCATARQAAAPGPRPAPRHDVHPRAARRGKQA